MIYIRNGRGGASVYFCMIVCVFYLFMFFLSECFVEGLFLFGLKYIYRKGFCGIFEFFRF